MNFTKNEKTMATEPTAIRAWADGRMIFIELTDKKGQTKFFPSMPWGKIVDDLEIK